MCSVLKLIFKYGLYLYFILASVSWMFRHPLLNITLIFEFPTITFELGLQRND